MSNRLISYEMDEQTARHCINEIRAGAEKIRENLVELFERKGYIALGYSSMRQCLEVEFSASKSYLYRQLNTALLQASLLDSGVDVPTPIKESHARAVVETLEGCDRITVFRDVITTIDNPSAETFRKAAEEFYVTKNSPSGTVVSRMQNGVLAVRDAYNITKLIENEPNDFVLVASKCTDPELVKILLRLYYDKTEIWYEILQTGTIPGVQNQVPLETATAASLLAWLDMSNSESLARSRMSMQDKINSEKEERRNKIIELKNVYMACVRYIKAKSELNLYPRLENETDEDYRDRVSSLLSTVETHYMALCETTRAVNMNTVF